MSLYVSSNGYSLFTIETLPVISHLPNNERLGEVSRRWKKLSEDKKEAYNLKAEEVHLCHIPHGRLCEWMQSCLLAAESGDT